MLIFNEEQTLSYTLHLHFRSGIYPITPRCEFVLVCTEEYIL